MAMGIGLSVCWANFGQTWANVGKKRDKVLDKFLILGQGVGQASDQNKVFGNVNLLKTHIRNNP